MSWKKVEKPLGKARPGRLVEHVERLAAPVERVHRGEVALIDDNESRSHQDLDGAYTWSPEGRRSRRVSTTPGSSERLNGCGAYDFTRGQCLIREDGPCDAMATSHFLAPGCRAGSWSSGTMRRATSPG